MLIRVMYLDNRYDMVKSSRLDNLIISGRIKRFYRSGESKWAVIGRDPIRTRRAPSYAGPERRIESFFSAPNP